MYRYCCVFVLGLISFLPAWGGPFDWTITVTPSQDLFGAPGSTIQWSYLIENLDTTDWLVLNSVNAGVFQYGIPNATFDYPIVAPNSTVTGPLYELTFDVNAPIGAVDSGTFDFTADFYTDDPFGSGMYDQPAPDKSVPYSATVAGAAVPEPGTAFLLCAAIPLMALGIRRRAS